MKRLIFILGGARSGKSRLAEDLAGRMGERVLYVATAEARDTEMAERIRRHRARRPASWRTLEAPLAVGQALRQGAGAAEVVLLDCLTLLFNNLLLDLGDDPAEAAAAARLQAEVDGLLAAYDEGNWSLIVVSNELGLGLVPPYPLGRVYRDVLGWAHQHLVERADRAYFVLAGVPLDLKRLQASLDDL